MVILVTIVSRRFAQLKFAEKIGRIKIAYQIERNGYNL